MFYSSRSKLVVLPLAKNNMRFKLKSCDFIHISHNHMSILNLLQVIKKYIGAFEEVGA